MKEQKGVSRPSVFERDIDALLERRLRTDVRFRNSMLSLLADRCPLVITSFKKIGVERQVHHQGATGTIDLLVRLSDGNSGETGRLLIENKLDSGFTPNQPERYASSAFAMSDSKCSAISVICAPRDYLSKSKYLAPFQARISYEDIAMWLDGEDRELIEAAILRFSMPYEPEPMPAVAEFHEGYVILAAERAPELVVKRNPNTANVRPEHSRTIYFDVKKCLPSWPFLPTLRFSHQCRDSTAASPSVKIMFDGWAQYEGLLRKLAFPVLRNTKLYLRKAGRSLGLVHDTPRMDNKRPVALQMDAVVTGIRAAASLRAWTYAHEEILREWSRVVENECRKHQ